MNSAFTLIELLVSIAIIALLIGILLPVLVWDWARTKPVPAPTGARAGEVEHPLKNPQVTTATPQDADPAPLTGIKGYIASVLEEKGVGFHSDKYARYGNMDDGTWPCWPEIIMRNERVSTPPPIKGKFPTNSGGASPLKQSA